MFGKRLEEVITVNGSEGPEGVIISPQAFNKMRKLARQYLKDHPNALDSLE
jgi:hypothetical protein